MLSRQTPWKPSQPAMKSQRELLRRSPSCRYRIDGRVALEAVEPRRRSTSKRSAPPVVEPRGDQVLHDLVLAVDRDRAGRRSASGSRSGAARRRTAARCPSWTSPSRSSRSPTPISRSRSTVPCSSTPARTRCSTYSRLAASSTTESMPSRCSRCASTRPGGPGADDADLRPLGPSAPDLLRGLDDQAQLGDLLVVRERVALHRGGEAALRRQAELFERRRTATPPRCAASARPSCSSSPRFVVTSPSTTILPFGHEAQRLEPARALVVVLQEEAVDLRAR